MISKHDETSSYLRKIKHDFDQTSVLVKNYAYFFH